MTRPLLVSLCAALAATSACGRRPSFSDPARPVAVASGHEFELALASNPSTGYRWTLLDSAALGPLQLVSREYRSSAPERNGAGGTERLRLRATRPGIAVVSLIYSRPFEHSAPADTTRFHVTVR